MPEADSPQEQEAESSANIISEIAERAEGTRWNVKWTSGPPGETRLYLEMPNGRDIRRIYVSGRLAERLRGIPFEEFRALGDYQAINNPQESYIEAYIRPPVNRPFGRQGSFLDIPGVEIIHNREPTELDYDDNDTEETEENSESVRVRFDSQRGDKWRIQISDTSKLWSLEFSEASPAAALIDDIARRYGSFQLPATLKIFGITAATHDEACLILEDIAGSIFLS